MGVIKKKKLKLPFKKTIEIGKSINLFGYPNSVIKMYYRDLFKKETEHFLNSIK